jgi:hypothetical protein
VRLFADWNLTGIEVHAYFPRGKETRAAGRAVVEHLIALFRDEATAAAK